MVNLQIKLKINGMRKNIGIHPKDMLAEVLRKEGYYGIKRGCNTGDCGSCTVLIDGVAQNSCTTFAASCDGKEITTIEGVGNQDQPHLIQRALVKEGAVQCGFCTPGVVLSVKALLDENPAPTEGEIKEALDGNLCRCTGYVKIIEAVKNCAAD